MSVDAFEQQLRRDGFVRTYVWEDGPDAYYSEHQHGCETAHIILEGQMTLGYGGESRIYQRGERCDVPAGVVHWARMGPRGCRYLIGEK